MYAIRSYYDEADIIGFKNAYQLPIVKNPCPMDGYSKREYAKELVKQLSEETKGAKDHIFRAITEGPFEACVITSYSIHYTKLYETAVAPS